MVEESTLIFGVHAAFAIALFAFGGYTITVLNDPFGIINLGMGIGVLFLGRFMARRRS